MRISILSLAFVGLLSLACSGGTKAVKNQACTVACDEASDQCTKKCPDGAGRKPCIEACGKAENQCVKACKKK